MVGSALPFPAFVSHRAIMSGVYYDAHMVCLRKSCLLFRPFMLRCHIIVPGLCALSKFSLVCSIFFGSLPTDRSLALLARLSDGLSPYLR